MLTKPGTRPAPQRRGFSLPRTGFIPIWEKGFRPLSRGRAFVGWPICALFSPWICGKIPALDNISITREAASCACFGVLSRGRARAGVFLGYPKTRPAFRHSSAVSSCFLRSPGQPFHRHKQNSELILRGTLPILDKFFDFF